MAFTFENISKSYGKTKALENISLSIKDGEFIGLIGKNGAGKSTFMRCMSQSEGIDRGSIFYNNINFNNIQLPILSDIFFLHENFTVADSKSIQDWGTVLADICPRFEQNIFHNLADNFSIDLKKSYTEMSRGQKMKAAFCLFAARRPKIYILDEITSVLDAGSRFTLMEFLKSESQKGATVIMSTNISSELVGYAIRVVVFENSRIVFNSKIEDLSKSFSKLRFPKDNRAKLDQLIRDGGIALRLNSDGYINLLIKKPQTDFTPSDLDQRQINIEDVAMFYTSTGATI